MPRAVVDLTSPRPVWRAPAETIRAVRTAFGPGWTVSVVRSAASSDGDGGTGSPEAVRKARGAEVYIGWGIPAAVAATAHGTLRWAHTAAAGVGASITDALRATGAIFTNSRGIQAEPMADWVLAAIGHSLRGFRLAAEAQQRRRWAKDEFTDGSTTIKEFAGTSVGIVGMGGVGEAVARRCVALGMVVRGIRRHPAKRRVKGVEWVRGPERLLDLARASEVLVIAAPHTASTQHLIDARVLRALPRGAHVVNVARGALIDDAALVAALDRGQVAGCVLDVFAREPLPRGHRYWSHPGVTVFPHASAVSDRFWERQTALLADNIARYRAGKRLRNVVDFDAGY